MTWLLRDGDVLAALDRRRRGWHTSLCGAVIVPRPGVVQTLTPSCPLDVAWCVPIKGNGGPPGLRVRRMSVLGPRRVSIPHLGPGALLVATAGTFERWRLHVGDELEVRGG